MTLLLNLSSLQHCDVGLAKKVRLAEGHLVNFKLRRDLNLILVTRTLKTRSLDYIGLWNFNTDAFIVNVL